MLVWLVVAVGIGLLCVLLWRASKGVARSLDGLDGPIRGLLRQGYDGGFLIIDRYSKTPFLQLRKYIRQPGEYGIELALPVTDWSKPFVPRIERLCREQGLRYCRELQNAEMVFLYVDFQQDVPRAHRFVIAALTKVFGWSEDARCFTMLQNADPRDVLIER